MRARLIRAARTIVRQDGFSKLTIVKVADTAGVATGSVYRHFDSKSALCAELFSRAARNEYAILRRVVHNSGHASAKMSLAIEVLARRVLANPTFAYALGVENVDAKITQEREAFYSAVMGLFEALIDEGIRAGEFDNQLSAISAGAVVGVIKESLLGPGAFSLRQSRVSSQLISAVQGFCLGAVTHPM